MDPKKLFIVVVTPAVLTAAASTAAAEGRVEGRVEGRAGLERAPSTAPSPPLTLPRALAPVARAARLCVRAFGVVSASASATPARPRDVEALPTAGNGKGPPRRHDVARAPAPSRS